MAREPWELTQAFADQLMRQAAQTEQQATRVQMAPIEQAMALDRLKQQGELELAQLPRKLSIEDAARQAPEARAYQRQQETEARKEEEAKRGELRAEERLPRTLGAQTDAAIAKAAGNIEKQIELYKKYGEDLEKATKAAKGGIGRSSVTDYHRPPTREGHKTPLLLPKDEIQAKQKIRELKKDGFEITDIESAWGNNFAHIKDKPEPTTLSNPPKRIEPEKPGPSLGQRLLEKLTGPPAPPVAGAAPKADKAPEPASTRPAASIPFSSIGAPEPPTSVRSMPSMIGDTRLPLPEVKTPNDKMSFLYESIRRRGYSDDEAKTILANVVDKPETKPTDDPDIFDVLVS